VPLLALACLLAGGPSPAGAGDPPALEAELRAHRGSVVVLNFWAAWCGPCKKELPLLARLEEEYAGRGVAFVGASTDAADERDEAQALLEKSKVRYRIVYGLSDADMQPLGLGELLPTTAIFDRDGTRAFRLVGEVTKKRLVERLEWLLGDRTGRPPTELLLPPGIDRGGYED